MNQIDIIYVYIYYLEKIYIYFYYKDNIKYKISK